MIHIRISGSAILLIAILIIFLIHKKNKSRTSANKKDYTAEAWRAYEDVTRKRKQDTKPPWEE